MATKATANKPASGNSPKVQPAQKVGGVRQKHKKAHASPKHKPVPQPIDKTFQTLSKVELPADLEEKKSKKIPKHSDNPSTKNPPAKQFNNNKKHNTHVIQQPKQGF